MLPIDLQHLPFMTKQAIAISAKQKSSGNKKSASQRDYENWGKIPIACCKDSAL